MNLANLEAAPTRLEEGLLLCAFAARSPNWMTSSALTEFLHDRLSCEFSGPQVRNALCRAMESFLLERRLAVDPALKTSGPRTGRKTVFEYRLSPEGVTIFNRRERERAGVLGYAPVLVPVPHDKAR
jgi:hypothetical protein